MEREVLRPALSQIRPLISQSALSDLQRPQSFQSKSSMPYMVLALPLALRQMPECRPNRHRRVLRPAFLAHPDAASTATHPS